MDIISNTNNIQNIKIPKKRGRKPKKKPVEDVVKVPKKRGRKPAGKIINLESREMNRLNHDSNCLIAHLPLKDEDIEKIEIKNNLLGSLSDTSLEKKNINFDNKYINHLKEEIKILTNKLKTLENKTSKEIFFKDYSVEKIKSKIIINDNNKFTLVKNTNIKCWWCCHSFNNTPFPLPNKYYMNKYHVFGVFCSPACCFSYNIDLNDHKIWERNSLILKLYYDLTGDKLNIIYPAPPRQILKMFGGNIDIEEFRNKSYHKYSSRYIIPPMVPLTTLIEESYKDRNKYEWNNKINMSKFNNLKKNIKIKIKRETKVDNDNNLEKIMGLKKIKIEE